MHATPSADLSAPPSLDQFDTRSGSRLERLIFNHGFCVQPAEDYQIIKTTALGRYRSQLEPIPPWREAALPPGLVQNCNSGHEFFFRYVSPLPSDSPASSPVI